MEYREVIMGKNKKKEQYDLGALISSACKSHGISYANLCSGILSYSTLMRILNNEIEVEKFVADQLFSRAGVCPDSLEPFIGQSDWNWFCKRQEILTSYNQKLYSKMEEQLKCYETNCPKSYPIHLQYVKMMQAYRLKEISTSFDFLNQALQALQCTIPTIHSIVWKTICLTPQELSILTLIAEGYWKTGNVSDSVSLLYRIISYPKLHPTEIEEILKFLPYARLILSQIYFETHQFANAISECYKGIQLLRDNNCIRFLIPLMEQYLQTMKEYKPFTKWSHKENKIFREISTYLHTLKNIMQDIPVCLPMLYSMENYENCHLISETLYRYRKYKKMTQQQFCEGICTVRAFREIEKGKTNPKKLCFRDFMRQCQLPETKYIPYIQGGSLTEQTLAKQFLKNIRLHKYKEAQTTIQELEQTIPLMYPTNQLFLNYSQILIQELLFHLSPEQQIQQYEKALQGKIPEYPNIDIEIYPFMLYEILILNNIACCYGNIGNHSESIKILTSIRNNYLNSKTSNILSHDGYCLILINLAKYLGLSGMHKKALAINQELIYREFSRGFIHYSNSAIYGIYWNLHRQSDSHIYDYKRYLDSSRDIAQLMKNYTELNFILSQYNQS